MNASQFPSAKALRIVGASILFPAAGAFFAAGAPHHVSGANGGILPGHNDFSALDSSARAPSDNAPAKTPRLSAKDRRNVFVRIWKDIRDRYYDPAFNGVDWKGVRDRYAPLVEAAKTDAEFYALMNRLTSELHDAHTRFNSPEAWSHRKKQQAVGAGFTASAVGGKAVITEVEPESDAARRGILPGMIVLRVDGQAVETRLAEIARRGTTSSSERATQTFTYRRVFGGPADSTITLGLLRADGSEFDTTLTRQVYPDAPSVISSRLPSGNAYIRFDGFQRPVAREFKEALNRFRDAPGLVIDLRKNGGGDLSVLLPIASYFFDKKTLFARDSTRTGKPLSGFGGLFRLPLKLSVGRPGDQIYSGPVAILVNARSASSSEVFAAGMQDTGRAKIVGSQTCGCVLGIAKGREMKGGGVLEISEVLWFSPKGRRLEGTGVLPDETAFPTIPDLQQRRDPALAQAEKTLGTMAAVQRAGAQF